MREMLNKRRNRAETGEEGFTLIELMVVVLIIGILLAIAVPTFLSAQKNAKSKAATSNLRSALSAVKTVYADEQSYAAIVLSDLRSAEPSLGWTADNGETDSPAEVSWQALDADTFYLAVESKLGDCFTIKDDTSTAGAGGTKYGKIAASTSPTCTASLASTAAGATPDAADW